MTEAILVLGMHRSGTSALTRVLNLVGCDISSNLRSPMPDNNEAGFWEPLDVSLIHEEMLASAGSSWDDVSEFPASWFDSEVARRFQGQILEILRRDFGDSPLFVVKDPRTCRLVPFWRRLLEELGAAPSFVISVRNPLEVARSLYARDRFPPAKSFLLWLRHVLAAERDSRGYRRSFISYNALLADWRRIVGKISDDLGIRFPRLSYQAAAEIDTFLSVGLRHQRASTQDLAEHSGVFQWVLRAYELLLEALEDGSEGLSERFDEIRAEVDRADTAYGPMIAHDHILLKDGKLKIDSLEAQFVQMSQQLVAGAQKQRKLECLLAEAAEHLQVHVNRLERENPSLKPPLGSPERATESQTVEIPRRVREENVREQRLLREIEENLSKVEGVGEDHDSELRRLAEQGARYIREVEELSALLADGKGREEQLRKDFQIERARGRRIAQQMSAGEQRIAQLERELARSAEVLMELRKAMAQRDGEVARQSAELAGQRDEIERLRTALARVHGAGARNPARVRSSASSRLGA